MLSEKEKAIVLISNAIAAYSLYQARGDLPKNTSMVDYIMKTIPNDMKKDISIELIDEIFEFVSTSHNS